MSVVKDGVHPSTGFGTLLALLAQCDQKPVDRSLCSYNRSSVLQADGEPLNVSYNYWYLWLLDFEFQQGSSL